MKHRPLPKLMSMPTKTVFRTKISRRTWLKPSKRSSTRSPWTKQTANGPLEDLEKVTKTAKPVYDGFWHDRDQDIINRLDLATRKLKEKRAAQFQDNKEDDTATHNNSNSGRSCSLCDEPLGHHVLQCTRENLQNTLKEAIHSTPVEPLTGPPKIVHPFPQISPQVLLPPPPGILANFSVKLNSVAKMCTGPPLQGSPDVDHHDNPAKSCAEEAVSRRNLKPYQLSLTRTPVS